MDVEHVAASLGRYSRKAGGGFMAQCPAHDDHDPSLSLDEKGGKLLVNCLAGCPQDSVIGELKQRGLWPETTHALPSPPPRKPVTRQIWRPIVPIPPNAPAPPDEHFQLGVPCVVWRYATSTGGTAFFVCRWDTTAGKEIRPLCFGNDGSWAWKAMPEGRPLLHLDKLTGNPDAPVLVVEGEKTADAAQRMLTGWIVTSWSGGCNAVAKTDWGPLQGRRIIVWPDADEPGRKAAADIGQKIQVQIVDPPHDVPEGWDLADAEKDGWSRERVETYIKAAQEPGGPGETPFSLTGFALNGKAAEMKSKMLEDRYVLGRMAILGQGTVIYAKPNVGKTLLTLWLLIDAIRRGEINAEDVFYVNADDTHKGLIYKLELAEKHGFSMLAPGYKGFKAEHLPEYLARMASEGTAGGKIVILDTVKKFTDLMRKDKASDFAEKVRRFVTHGGSVIALAHCNKHRDDQQKVVYSGTTDLVDDFDCAYTLDVVTEDAATSLRTIKFENFKARGDVERESFYRYDYADGTPYEKRLESVHEISKTERKEAERRKRLEALLEKNRAAVDAIRECLQEGINQKTALIDEAATRSGLSKKKITKALSEHTGGKPSENQFWNVSVGDKNAHLYTLNYGVF